jgi:tRNA (cytidine56-2'-O)-methyltransferase
MYLEPPDTDLARRVGEVSRSWGGDFGVIGLDNWRPLVRSSDVLVVHLTMYGLPLERVLPRLRRAPRVLLVVGGAKVPPDLYRLSDVNVAVGHQPHSEVAAVALLLDRLLGPPRSGRWPGARRSVVPRARGKKIIEHRGEG